MATPNSRWNVSSGIEQLKGWVGLVDRIQAEEILETKPVSSYLLRNGDEFTEVTASQLSESNNLQLGPYLCTIKENEGKISDVLFLFTDLGWTIYRDNPDLRDSEYIYYNSPDALLHNLSDRARLPI